MMMRLAAKSGHVVRKMSSSTTVVEISLTNYLIQMEKRMVENQLALKTELKEAQVSLRADLEKSQSALRADLKEAQSNLEKAQLQSERRLEKAQETSKRDFRDMANNQIYKVVFIGVSTVVGSFVFLTGALKYYKENIEILEKVL